MPVGYSANDVMLLYVVEMDVLTPTVTTITTASGNFALLGGVAQPANYAGNHYLSVWWKVANGSEGSSYTINGSTNNKRAICAAWTGRGSSVSTFTSTANSGAGATPVSLSFGGLTAAANDDLALFALCSTIQVATYSVAGFTQQAQVAYSAGSSGVYSLLTENAVSAGATGAITGTVSYTSGNTDNGGILVTIPSGIVVPVALLMGQICL
jgi:hypothetical protein